MNSAPEVSFVVNAFNTEGFIAACLNSIFALQDAPEFEVIVIDDCSTDGTAAVVKGFTDPRLIYLRNEVNLNAAASVNIAFAKARGQFIARIDSDDEYRPHFLNQTLPILREHPNVGVVFGEIELMSANGQLQGAFGDVAKRRAGRPLIGRELQHLLLDNYIPAPGTIARRAAWDSALPVPAGRNFCDWYLTLNMARKWDFAFVDEVLANYRLHPGNMHKAMLREKYGETITWLNLDEIFAAEHFGDGHQALKDEAYATHSAILGQRYYGMHMMSDARRCLQGALRRMPSWLWKKPQLAKWWLFSWVPTALHRRGGTGE
jgi:glycosyltransferase involved in cell wall biosynthesis